MPEAAGLTVWAVLALAAITAIATGVGALPLAVVHPSRKFLGIGAAGAAGLMIVASVGLVAEGWSTDPGPVLWGTLLGAAFIVVSRRILASREDLVVGQLDGADARRAILLVGAMTVHSAAEGIAVGVSFGGGEELGLFITAAIAVHNIPEGLAIALVLVPRGISVAKAAGWSIVTSLPQPLLAVPAFLFVIGFAPLLPWGLGFAAGAMVWMVVAELIPEAVEEAGTPWVAATVALTVAVAGALQWWLGP